MFNDSVFFRCSTSIPLIFKFIVCIVLNCLLVISYGFGSKSWVSSGADSWEKKKRKTASLCRSLEGTKKYRQCLFGYVYGFSWGKNIQKSLFFTFMGPLLSFELIFFLIFFSFEFLPLFPKLIHMRVLVCWETNPPLFICVSFYLPIDKSFYFHPWMNLFFASFSMAFAKKRQKKHQ